MTGTLTRPTIERVAAVIPVLDEEVAIADVVRGSIVAGVCCVIVVDGGSRDRTREVARAAGATVLVEPRRGYGRACRTGTDRALSAAADGHEHDAVAYLDGDGSCDPADLPRLISRLATADVVLGRRPRHLAASGAMPGHARLGNALVAVIVSALTGRRIHDFPPAKVARVATLRRLRPDDDRFGWTVQFVTRAVRDRRIRVAECGVVFHARRGGISKVSGSWRTSLAVGRTMIGVALRESRIRPTLALMAKAPRAGHAKTRMAAELGEEHTASLWQACLADTAATLARTADCVRLSTLTMVAVPEDVDAVRSIVGLGWTVRPQRSGGLASALVEVFLDAFDQGADRAIAVAGDNPTLPPECLASALRTLATAPRAAVLGPSMDGGYHLVGLRWPTVRWWWPAWLRTSRRTGLERRLRHGFTAGPLGSPTALEVTRRGLATAGWTVAISGAWPDLDTLDDLRQLAPSLATDPDLAPRTAAWVLRHHEVMPPGSNGHVAIAMKEEPV